MKKNKYNILITAVGGDIGQGIAKILRRSDLANRIIGTDVSSDNPARNFVDSFYLVPKADSPEYLKRLEQIIDKEKIDFLIPVSEPELKAVWDAKNNRGWEPARLVMPGGLALPLCLDKLDTMEFLKKQGILVPWTSLVSAGDPPALPCILKDRWGWGSKSFQLIDDLESARFFAKRRPNAIFQEKLSPGEAEYTCGIFRSSNGNINIVVLHRMLASGLTGKAVVMKDEEIENLCRKVAEALSLRGSINLQLIKTKNGPMPFEINPRFSSTAIFRDAIGFKDVIWSLLDLLGEEIGPSFTPPVGARFYRIYDEIIIAP